MGKEVHQELDGEEEGEGHVQDVEDLLDSGRGTFDVVQPLPWHLCFVYGRREVLHQRHSVGKFECRNRSISSHQQDHAGGYSLKYSRLVHGIQSPAHVPPI